jgi:YHS domain-containing protein
MKRIYLPLILLFLICGITFADEQKQDNKITKVEPSKVCMVNNHVFDKDQIPVSVDGKTYYGCCEMCKKTLAEKEEARMSTDPVSGKPVDKAKAVIGAKTDGTVLYFENEDNLEKYNASQQTN